jgi:MFS family permease
MQPIYGRLSDIFGRKFVLLGSLTIFLIGSLACALAQSMIQLIIFRAIQGIGGGGILTLSMIISESLRSLIGRVADQGQFRTWCHSRSEESTRVLLDVSSPCQTVSVRSLEVFSRKR